METRSNYQLPEDKQKKLKKAIVLEWVTIFFILTITVVMYLAMGASQAMKTAWIEDVLSLIPPISFLVAMHFRDKKPNNEYPYGYRRAPLLSFMVAAVALLILGLYMLYDSSMGLIKQEHPTLGHFYLFGNSWQVWSGWVMIVALIYSVIPPMILGRMKLPLGKELHEKTLYADATMNKADWMTGGAAIIGILGIGLGFWWADSAAAGFISLSVVKDGLTNVKHAMADLMDQRPTDVSSGKPLKLEDRLRDELNGSAGVAGVEVRLREEGHAVTGEVFVVLHEHKEVTRQIDQLAEQAAALDWRLYNLTVMPVPSIKE